MTKYKTNYWLLPDTHFGHQMLNKEGHRKKGFEWEILCNVATMVEPHDVLIHLGDVAFYKDDYWIEELIAIAPCKRWLLLGNHDRRTYTWYLEYFDFVGEAIQLNMFGKRILLTHRPQPDAGQFDINIHGHLHDKKTDWWDTVLNEKHMNLYLEHQYTPFNLRKLVGV